MVTVAWSTRMARAPALPTRTQRAPLEGKVRDSPGASVPWNTTGPLCPARTSTQQDPLVCNTSEYWDRPTAYRAPLACVAVGSSTVGATVVVGRKARVVGVWPAAGRLTVVPFTEVGDAWCLPPPPPHSAAMRRATSTTTTAAPADVLTIFCNPHGSDHRSGTGQAAPARRRSARASRARSPRLAGV